MAFGKGKQQGVTGPDYLLAAAAGAVEDGRPFAEEFQNMVFQAFVPDFEPGIASQIAQRALSPNETTAAGCILHALMLARNARDKESEKEVIEVGLMLLAKWPAYLVSRPAGHPDFTLKDNWIEY